MRYIVRVQYETCTRLQITHFLIVPPHIYHMYTSYGIYHTHTALSCYI